MVIAGFGDLFDASFLRVEKLIDDGARSGERKLRYSTTSGGIENLDGIDGIDGRILVVEVEYWWHWWY